MAYYYMKCVHCLRQLKNEEVLFDVTDSVVSADSLLAGDTVLPGHQSMEKVPQDEQPDDQLARLFDSEDAPAAQAKDIAGKFRLKDCEAFFKEYWPIYQKPQIPESDAKRNVADNQGVLMQIQFVDSSNKKKITMARYCPHCGKPLPPQAGMMPTYAILFLGASSAGKTVYISSIYYSMMRALPIPGHGCLLALPAGNSNTSFHSIATRLFREGMLPGITTVFLPEPLTLEVQYSVGNKLQKKCLLCFVDMRGEDMKESGRLVARNSLIQQADAFLMAIDPLSIDRIAIAIAGDIAREERGSAMADSSVHMDILKHISEEILPTMPGGKIKAPSVVMLTKMDKIINGKRAIRLVSDSHLTINPLVSSTYDREYLARMGHSSAELFAKADYALFTGIKSCFENPYFTTVSSLGCQAVVGSRDGEPCIINGSQFIIPLRVMDPVIVLLTKLGFLPLMEAVASDMRRGQVIIH